MAQPPRPPSASQLRRATSAQSNRGQIRRPSNSRSASMAPPPRPGAVSPADFVTPSTAGPKKNNDTSETTQIKVAVRCRGRNAREIDEQTDVAVFTPDGIIGTTLETRSGEEINNNNKLYQFDKVFSGNATQEDVYNEAIAPHLDDLIAGYNCTVLAYGQTGTGKTYTMTGELSNKLGMVDDNAGIIPRVLHSLFEKLLGYPDATVKCQFVELYNENLTDLISADNKKKLDIVTNSTGGQSTNLVRGAEDVYISNAAAGVKILEEGTKKRQVAATYCNDQSSRSHSIFTIFVQVKHQHANGKEYLSVAKLNLVDLAGSENIGRSGAQGQQSAEAGSINKSLLSLGRVINALVDGTVHIPYRESNLTRLLQDSLGGQTKTCIIATVSPLKANIDETVSTLTYAYRAKDIRNKPQVNPSVSKATALKELAAEVESYKRELIAARKKDGIWLSQEAHKEMIDTAKSSKLLITEQTDKINAIEQNLRKKVQILYDTTAELTNAKNDFEGIKVKLDTTQDALEQSELVLATTNKKLAKQEALREAFEENEDNLVGIGTGLINTLDKTVDHVEGLHAKIRRKSHVESLNRNVWADSQSTVFSVTSSVESHIDEVKAQQESLVNAISLSLKSFISEELQKLANSREFLAQNVESFGASRDEIIQQTETAKKAMNDLLDEIEIAKEDTKCKFQLGYGDLEAATSRITETVDAELEKLKETIFASWGHVQLEVQLAFRHVIDQNKDAVKEIEALDLRQQHAVNDFASSHHHLVDLLTLGVETENERAKRERADLMRNLFTLVEAYGVKQEQKYKEVFADLGGPIKESSDRLVEEVTQVSFDTADWMAKRGKDAAEQESRLDQLHHTFNAKRQDSTWAIDEIKGTAGKVYAEHATIMDNQIANMQSNMAAFDDFVTRAKAENADHHTHHAASVSALSASVTSSYSKIGDHFTESYGRVKQVGEDIEGQVDTISETLTPIYATLQEPLATLREKITATDFAEYAATGQTPAKQKYKYPRTLPRTDGNSVLARLQEAAPSTASPDIFVDETATVPSEIETVPTLGASRSGSGALASITEDEEMSFSAENADVEAVHGTLTLPRIRERTPTLSSLAPTEEQHLVVDRHTGIVTALEQVVSEPGHSRSLSVDTAVLQLQANGVTPRANHKRGPSGNILSGPRKRRSSSVVSNGRENSEEVAGPVPEAAVEGASGVAVGSAGGIPGPSGGTRRSSRRTASAASGGSASSFATALN